MGPERAVRYSEVLYMMLLTLGSAAIGSADAQSIDSPKVPFERMVAARQKVQNFRCQVHYDDSRPDKGEGFLRALDKFGPEEKKRFLESSRGSVGSVAAPTFEDDLLAFDSEGRGRVEMVMGAANSDGTPGKVAHRTISIWDGKSAVEFSKEEGRDAGNALLTAEPVGSTSPHTRQPWTQFGGNFVGFMAAAIADGNTIDVKNQSDGTYRVKVPCKGGILRIGVVDPNQGYSVKSEETYRGDKLLARDAATFRQVAPGVWFPVEGEGLSYDEDKPGQVRRQMKVRISDIKINDPNFYRGLFRVDLPKGTMVADRTSGMNYTTSEPMTLGREDVPSAGETPSKP